MDCLVVVAIGTLGDVLPFLRLASFLTKHFKSVQFLSNADHRHRAESAGLQFVSIAEPMPAQDTQAPDKTFEAVVLPSFIRSAQHIKYVAETRGKPVLVCHDLALGAIAMAMDLQLPFFRVILAPAGLPGDISTTPLPRDIERQLVGATIAKLGICIPDDTLGLGHHEAVSNIALFPSEFRMQSHTASDVHFAGFPYGHTINKEDAELMAYLESHKGAVLIATPGTGIQDGSSFFRAAGEACQHLGVRAVFVGSTLLAGTFSYGLSRSFAEFSRILPFASVALHHGGVGTTAEALRAGIPQIILPRQFDQPHNAKIIERLGVGISVDAQHNDSNAIIQAKLRLDSMTYLPTSLRLAKNWASRQNGVDIAARIVLSIL